VVPPIAHGSAPFAYAYKAEAFNPTADEGRKVGPVHD
jgi:hypothetical protein